MTLEVANTGIHEGNTQVTMQIDNYPVIPDRPPTPKESQFWTRLTDILRKQLDMKYADLVDAYRQLEQEFVHDSDDDALDTRETKRHIAECILVAAHDHEQPFEVCRDAWNMLVELGFSNLHSFANKAWFYAQCCLFNAQYEVGLGVVDAAIAEIERRLDEPNLICRAETFYDHELNSLDPLREGLVAYKSSKAEGDAWNERREAEFDAQPDQQWTPQEREKTEIVSGLSRTSWRIKKNASRRSHAEMVNEYQQAEADFLARLEGDNKTFEPDVRSHFATAILEDAYERHEAFEICQTAWNELVRWGFPDLELQCGATRVYGECCLFNRQPATGIVAIESALAELQRHIAKGIFTAMPQRRCERKIARLEKLRDKLHALSR
jgi:hypothetical protein